eukprot:CAMPEP_0197080574 /NCGR_PEP_ID=MMETSP1384-20130603/214199_1 /TAXON_ID=29189 /ORGANISM="Ammonia sp." /LENGTH=463 /DNA_ID=CAMNT_0042519461 /DNA_START=43 /DNA_END=1434 /DNA_ORIENTATION=-
MPRKNQHTAKHPHYQKPDFHAQNKPETKQPQNGSTEKPKKSKLRTSNDVYQRLLCDKKLGIDLNDVSIGYQHSSNVQEIPFLHWKMIDNGGDIPMHRIQYFALRSQNGSKTIIWDRRKRIDLLFKDTSSLQTLLSHKQHTKSVSDDTDEKYVQRTTCTKSPLSMLDSLISVFSNDTHCDHESASSNDVNSTNKRIGILFMGGSYNPVHAQHLELMCVIKQYFEEKHDIHVIAGYLVITTDKYVYGKLKDEAISFVHRKRLCELSCADKAEFAWLHPSEYECSSAIQYLQREFLPKYPKALMINCMGADKILSNTKKGKNKGSGKWIRYSKNLKNRKCLTVCINRRGYADHAYNLYLRDKEDGKVNPKAFMFINVNVDAVSSTMIRKILKQYQNERQLELQQATNENAGNVLLEKYARELRTYVNEQCVHYLLSNIDHLWWRPSEGKASLNTKAGRNLIVPWDD